MKMAMIMSLFVTDAHAHESLVPHTHPHGISMLSGIETSVVALLALAAVMLAYWTLGREHQ